MGVFLRASLLLISFSYFFAVSLFSFALRVEDFTPSIKGAIVFELFLLEFRPGYWEDGILEPANMVSGITTDL